MDRSNDSPMNRNTPTYICLVALALLIAGALLVSPAIALKVEGARIALDVEPGKTYTSPLGISITAEESGGTFAIDVMGFGQAPTDGSYTALDAAADTSPYSARPFITIDKPTVTLQPGERAAVTATINIPSGTRDGGRYAIILVHPAASASGAPASFATAVAIPVLLTVKSGTITETGQISAVEPPVTEVGKPFEVKTTFQNSGNYHYYGAVHNVTITDTQGTLVASVKSEPFVRAIVPGQSVTFTASVANGLPQGSYQVTARVEKQDGKVLAEKKATLQAGSPPTTQATTVAPSKGLLPGFGTLLTLMGLAVAFFGVLRVRKGGTG
ncbi:MAG: hypothetical protein A4E37_00418 [Methanoregulaceae archaeon PtaB.Bin056]|nr:MAG: hypothetical protein A4E37_00418 [Methanoregulaceae archaeon PtaB.Bin056]